MLETGDFLKIEYNGYDKNNNLFDSTNGEIAKRLRGKDGPILVVYGKNQIIKGLEEKFNDLEIGKEVEIIVPPKKGFGDKKKELVQVMRVDDFKKHNIIPKIGLSVQVNFKNEQIVGIIKSVSSGRVLVDFNHPLAGQKLKYKIKILEIIKSEKDKIKLLIQESGLKYDYKLDGKKLNLILKQELSKEDKTKQEMLLNAIKQYMPKIEVSVKSEK